MLREEEEEELANDNIVPCVSFHRGLQEEFGIGSHLRVVLKALEDVNGGAR